MAAASMYLRRYVRSLLQQPCRLASSAQSIFNLEIANQANNVAKQQQNVTLEDAKPYESIPGPKMGFFWSIFMLIRLVRSGEFRKPWFTVQKAHAEFGDIVRSGLGSFENVMLLDPNDVEKVLRNEGKYPRRIEITPWIAYREHTGKAKGVLLVEGQDWHRNRLAISKRILRPKEVAEYAGTINAVVTDFISRLERKRSADENGVIQDIENDFFKYAMDAAGSVLFDRRLNLLDDNLHVEEEAFIKSVHIIFSEMINLLIVPVKYHKMFNTKSWQRLNESWDIIFDHATKLIDEKLNKVYEQLKEDDVMEQKADFLTYLVMQKKISVEEIYANTTELLAAAVDTTSNTTLWSLYLLANNPDVQKRLQEEVERIIPANEIPMPSHIERMPYLKNVVRETLRLFPPAINVGRILEKDIVLKGYRIPAGKIIAGQIMMMGRDARNFKDPLKFKPERWLRGGKTEAHHPFSALPFGFGPRMCIGRRLAELEMYLLLSRISQTYWVESLRDVEPVMTSLITPEVPTQLKFTKK